MRAWIGRGEGGMIRASTDFLKKWGDRLGWGRGPERNAREASVGFPPGHKDKRLSPSEEAGGIFPALSPEKSAPYDSKRAGLAPGSWKPLAPASQLSSKS